LIGLDTNVIIRYLVQDDAKQAALATDLIERQLSAETPGVLSNVVLCEIVWVLEDCYHLPRPRVSEILQGLFSARQIALEDTQRAWQALRALQRQAIDFSDALIGLIAQGLGCTHTVTFDKDAAKLEHFKLLQARS
jgi:predicted nucleic-acid-binding protein